MQTRARAASAEALLRGFALRSPVVGMSGVPRSTRRSATATASGSRGGLASATAVMVKRILEHRDGGATE